jgi:predicted negative regulator of RcsB-dependent stress response
VAKLTRKELKTDKFVLEVEHGVEFFSQHRPQIIRWGGIALGLIVVILAINLYRNHERHLRQEALHAAMEIQNATIGGASSDFMVSFSTAAERDKAVKKAFGDLAAKYRGTTEGSIAEFFLGTNAADNGNLTDAEKHFKAVIDSGPASYASVAKLSLAQVYAGQGKVGEGEKLIQSVIDHPTVLVSKEEATIALGELLEPSDPQKARKVLEPLRNSPRSPVSRAAITAVGQLPPQPAHK